MGAMNGLAVAWWQWISAASWQLALFVPLVAVASVALRRMPARFRYILWMLVLVKAFVPPSFNLPLGVGTWGVPRAEQWAQTATGDLGLALPGSGQAQTSRPHGGQAALTAAEGDPAAGFAGVRDAHSPSGSLISGISKKGLAGVPAAASALFTLWLIGGALLSAFIAARYLFLLARIHKGQVVDEGPLPLLVKRLSLGLGCQGAPELILCDDVTSPFLVGLLRQRIVLPAELPSLLSCRELENVLLHELVHWRRCDVLVGWIQVFVHTLFWFHPFMWFAGARLRHECESACDAAVLDAGEDSPKGYGESLLKVLITSRGRSPVTLGFLGIFERNTRLQNRLEAIMNPVTNNLRLRVAGWAFLAVCAMLFLPMAEAQNTQADAAKPAVASANANPSLSAGVPDPARYREPAAELRRLKEQVRPLGNLLREPGKEKEGLQELKKIMPDVERFAGSVRGTQFEPPMQAIVECLKKLEKAVEGGRPEEVKLLTQELNRMGSSFEDKLEIAAGNIQPVPNELVPRNTITVGWVGDKSQGMRSLGASGHAVTFMRADKDSWLEAVTIYAARYGTAAPPPDNFFLYILNSEKQVIADVKFPYALIERGDMKWYTLRTPSIEVPNEFMVALSFNPHRTRGIYLGFDKAAAQSHSQVGLPESGFEPVKEREEWMVRVHLAEAPTGVKGKQALADWKPPVKVELFNNCIEAKYDNGKSDSMQSYGSRGPAIQMRPTDFLAGGGKDMSGAVLLKGFRVYASRYGSGFDPAETTMKVTVLDSAKKVIYEERVPYSLFSYKAKWVDVPLQQPFKIEKPADTLIFAFDPEAHQTKGIYFHYNKNLQPAHSLAGRGVEFQPVADREWMIRAYFAR